MRLTILVLFCFWIFILQVFAGNIVYQLPLCCPVGWSLAKLRVGLFRVDRYDCLSPPIAKSLVDEVEIIGETLPLGGHHLQPQSNFTNIPNCTRPELMIFYTEKNIELTSNTCLARFDSRIGGISCLAKDTGIQMMSFMHKCCPFNHYYDSAQRKCLLWHTAPDYTSYSDFFAQGNSGIIFLDMSINCPRDKVLIEYHLHGRDISFEDGQLVLKNVDTSNTFSIRDYCIETMYEKDVVFANTNTSKVNDSGLLVEQVANVLSVQMGKRKRLPEYLVRTCTDVNVCEHTACIRRCCADGEMFIKGNATSYCKRDDTDLAFHSFKSLEISGNFSKPAVFGILRSLDCLKYRFNPEAYPDEMHTINERDGSLYVPSTHKNYTRNQYCLEKVRNSVSGDQKLYTFVCFDSKVVDNDMIRFKMYPIGLLISCLFYAMTLIVYLSISRLRNLPGKILICLVSSLFAAYLSIALGQLMPTSNDDVCFASGFFVYFCLMAAFAWMNVMCFDIWQTFGSAKKSHGIKRGQTKRFVLYSTYGWGLPTTLTVLTVSLTKADVLSESIRPHFGHGRCWFSYDTLASANLLFFSGPVGILFLINLVLFSLTLRYCNRVKREIFRMQSSNMEKPMLKRRFFVDKARFAMNTKLFIVMGITWLLELLSILFYDHKKTFFWAISDSFNVLLGVFVFFIFVFKKRVWYSVLEKVGLRPKDSTRTLQNVTLATPSVCTQSISMTRLNAIDGNVSLLPSGTVKRSPLL